MPVRAGILIALVLVLAGCGGAPSSSHSRPTPTDHGDLARVLEVSLDAPSSGAPGYKVDLDVLARDVNRTYSYAWKGDLTVHFDAVAYDKDHDGRTDCNPPNFGFDVQGAIGLDLFDNAVGAGEHWSLQRSIQDNRLGNGQYTVTVTAHVAKGHHDLVEHATFNHC